MEILLIAGVPGSGKSSIAKRFVELNLVENARHLSIGDLKRSIVAGDRPSAYAEVLRQKRDPHPKTGTAPTPAMIGIMEEFILERPSGLTILDGFPRYADRILPFKDSVERLSAAVLALCIVEVDESIARQRLTERPSRKHQQLGSPEFLEQRLADHRNNIAPTLQVLAQDYPTYVLDGAQAPDVNAQELLSIYEQHSHATPSPERLRKPPVRNEGDYPRIYLVEGKHFRDRTKDKSIFNAIKRELGRQALLDRPLLLAGYDAAHDRQSGDPPRTSTYAMSLREFQRALGVDWLVSPLTYAGMHKATTEEPAVGIYDAERLHVVSSHSATGVNRCVSQPGQLLETAKLAEVHLLRRGEEWRLPE